VLLAFHVVIRQNHRMNSLPNAAEDSPLLAVSRPAPGVMELRLDRPHRANALSTPLLSALAEALKQADFDETVRAVVLTGGSTLFSIGADPADLAALPPETTSDPRAECYARIAAFPKPLVAAVCGPALGGGCELVLVADIVIAGTSARFALPETALGLIPGAGGTQRLVRIVGRPLAMQMILAGTELTAADAFRVGLVGEVVPDEACLPRARELAQTIAARPPRAVQAAKAAVLHAFELPLAAGLALERRMFLDLLNQPAHQKTSIQAPDGSPGVG
jgi:enoyl-CoA hydratase